LFREKEGEKRGNRVGSVKEAVVNHILILLRESKKGHVIWRGKARRGKGKKGERGSVVSV